MFGGASMGSGGGGSFSGESSSASSTGQATLGDFVFQPKGGGFSLPTVAWIVIGAVGLVLALKVLR